MAKNKKETRLSICGQSLIEWCVFSLALIALWTATLQIAQKLLNRTVSDVWSVTSARQALSKATTVKPPGVLLAKTLEVHSQKGSAIAISNLSLSHYSITVPQKQENVGRSFFNSFSFGSLASLFLQ